MNVPFDGVGSADPESPTTAESTAHNETPDQVPAVKKIVVVNAGTGEPSSTGMLADRTVARVLALADKRGVAVEARTINLRNIASDVMVAITTQHVSPDLQQASDLMRDADGIIAATPIYKAGASGLFTAFFQVLDNDLLIGTPVVLGATAGSARHSLVVDDQLRGLFSYLRTITVPTSLVSSPDDYNTGDFGKRVDRAATELLALIEAGFRETVRGDSWNSYQHSFGSAGGSEFGIDFDSDLMRMATGGK